MTQVTIENPNAKSCWVTVRFERGGEVRTILNVETDLTINADDPKHDKEAFAALGDSIADFMEAHPTIDAADVSQIRGR